MAVLLTRGLGSASPAGQLSVVRVHVDLSGVIVTGCMFSKRARRAIHHPALHMARLGKECKQHRSRCQDHRCLPCRHELNCATSPPSRSHSLRRRHEECHRVSISDAALRFLDAAKGSQAGTDPEEEQDTRREGETLDAADYQAWLHVWGVAGISPTGTGRKRVCCIGGLFDEHVVDTARHPSPATTSATRPTNAHTPESRRTR